MIKISFIGPVLSLLKKNKTAFSHLSFLIVGILSIYIYFSFGMLFSSDTFCEAIIFNEATYCLAARLALLVGIISLLFVGIFSIVVFLMLVRVLPGKNYLYSMTYFNFIIRKKSVMLFVILRKFLLAGIILFLLLIAPETIFFIFSFSFILWIFLFQIVFLGPFDRYYSFPKATSIFIILIISYVLALHQPIDIYYFYLPLIFSLCIDILTIVPNLYFSKSIVDEYCKLFKSSINFSDLKKNILTDYILDFEAIVSSFPFCTIKVQGKLPKMQKNIHNILAYLDAKYFFESAKRISDLKNVFGQKSTELYYALINIEVDLEKFKKKNEPFWDKLSSYERSNTQYLIDLLSNDKLRNLTAIVAAVIAIFSLI